ncbi:hypothetical protein [Niveibacterium sp. SC-1]|uniref:SCO family protein n=1 Tax=Niveibacterium sp. SC-1 TaxID=3135646 RepID=UPI00311F2320
MQAEVPVDTGARLRGRRTLILIALVCLAPVVASYLTFWFWKPAAAANYGELLEAAPWKPAQLRKPGGESLDPASLKGRWLMVYSGAAACDAACSNSLWVQRQVRTAQAKEMGRVARVWLVTDGGTPAPTLLAEHPDLLVLRAEASAAPQGRIELVDPLGNLMMRYPAEPEPKRMIKDLTRILKYSPLGKGD